MMIWSGVMVIGGTWWVRNDVAAYRRFGLVFDTAERQRTYWRWLAQSFAILVGASLVSLWLARGLSPFDGFPAVFEPAHLRLQPRHAASGDHWMLMAAGLASGISVSVAWQWRKLKAALSPRPAMDAALIPRNRREGMIALLLSINAGFSEELFFRLALPLFVFQLTHSLPVALAVSILCFGLAHAHYGWKGVLATMGAGGLLTLYYLSHGSLPRVMIAHAAIDVIAFFVRPALVDWVASRKAPSWLQRSGIPVKA